jgi:hypothetical protein
MVPGSAITRPSYAGPRWAEKGNHVSHKTPPLGVTDVGLFIVDGNGIGHAGRRIQERLLLELDLPFAFQRNLSDSREGHQPGVETPELLNRDLHGVVQVLAKLLPPGCCTNG